MANPIVKVRSVVAGTGYVVWCATADCDYAGHAIYKTAAQQLQRTHAYRHRADRNRVARSAGAR